MCTAYSEAPSRIYFAVTIPQHAGTKRKCSRAPLRDSDSPVEEKIPMCIGRYGSYNKSWFMRTDLARLLLRSRTSCPQNALVDVHFFLSVITTRYTQDAGGCVGLRWRFPTSETRHVSTVVYTARRRFEHRYIYRCFCSGSMIRSFLQRNHYAAIRSYR